MAHPRRTWCKCDDCVYGPVYYQLGSGVAKFRKIPRGQLTDEQREAYSAALMDAVRAKQRQSLQHELPTIKPRCASGTWHNGYIDTSGRVVASAKIGPAIRAQQRAELAAYPDKVRSERTPEKWEKLYRKAMGNRYAQTTYAKGE
jgi:hypothetical protein